MARTRKSIIDVKVFHQKVKALRRYATGLTADDGLDLRKITRMSDISRAKRRKVEALFDLVNGLTARPNRVFRSSDPVRLRKVQAAAQHPAFPKELKVAFIPSNPGAPMRVKFIAGEVVFIQRGVTRRVINIPPELLITDPFNVVLEATKQHPARTYSIQAGEFEIQRGYSPNLLAGEVVKLMNKYDARSQPDNKKMQAHDWRRWLGGIIAYNFDAKPDYDAYRVAKERASDKLKLLRESARRAEKERVKTEKLFFKLSAKADKRGMVLYTSGVDAKGRIIYVLRFLDGNLKRVVYLNTLAKYL